ncbi:DUF1127 domain-containing protein [Marinibaculum pumilum]|uniref:DUF1127 domain-containing protein n=1 Tax=Marinibaculum pumilum TaxID=1766165 RepID=A0ABV7L6W7_9PROT
MASTTFNGLNSSHVSTGSASAPGRIAAPLAAGHWYDLDRIGRQMRIWRNRSRERAELAHMSDLDLADIGVSRADAEAEAGKPFWQV